MDDLLGELEAMLAPQGDGMRTVEIAEEFGISKYKASAMIDELFKQDKLLVVGKRITTRDGKPLTVSAYRLRKIDSS